MTFSEFGHAINNYKEPETFQLSTKIVELYNKQDVQGLHNLLENENNSEVFDVYKRLNKLIIKAYIYNLDPTFVITEEEKNFLTSYLYEIEEWTEFELYIFGNTMSILSESDLIFLGKAFVDRDKLYQSLTSHKKIAEIVFLNLILLLLTYRKLYQANYFIEALEKILTYQDMFAMTCLNFFKKIIVHLENKTEDLSDLEHFISRIEEIDNPIMASYLKANLSRIFIDNK
jgi:Rgg/GadR/MutR family transcriptional activator